ncbi:protein kinase C-binding protein NELL1 isoform X4 [Cephus cinctus]|uniref:Protein kinase C-binding protein NELL1 isoform X4 n=1 Tax=Cephus cinctus TaxID=211228 RepID=A0AAJ7BST8_CEPCN|nr:protein kinase C-binding protein NELL1 isoform X4 [Cephus cinctus]
MNGPHARARIPRRRRHARRRNPYTTKNGGGGGVGGGDDDDERQHELLDSERLFEPAQAGWSLSHEEDLLLGHFTDTRHETKAYQHTHRRRRRRGRRRLDSATFLLVAAATAFLALATQVPPVSGASGEKEEAVEATAVAAAATVGPTGMIMSRGSSTGAVGLETAGSIDLLAALQLHNTTRIGVSPVPGLVRLRPAYYLQGNERELRVSEAGFERAAALLRRVPEFTVAAALRQEEANSGTIVAFSHGNNRYLELQSSGRKDELRLHYVSRRDGAVHVEAFPFRLADGAWHRVALSVSGSQVELLVDCHPLYRRLLRPGPPDTNFTVPQLQLWVGQRNAKHFLFKGALQDVKLIPGAHGYLSQCPQLDSSCPTCGQFSILQNTVEQLMQNLNELTRRLAAAEGRISKVEECECQKACRVNGTVHDDGATWEKGCQQCSCVHGEIECRPTPCVPVTCKNPVLPENQCCPICLKQCYIHGMISDHGEKVSPKQCVECDCNDGSFTCQRIDTKTRCPPLPCPPSEQISVAEECCKFCPDVDECKQQGGSEGHHCNANTRCVNVVGSYTCECLPGYDRVDKFNCAELDECATGRHTCAEHATCINTPGSYYCQCNEGYMGDGHICKPMCSLPCQNGGECVAPGRCSCRRGYIGSSCELDLDECASDLHRCDRFSTCFNVPGWYYCRCKPGYRSALHDSNQGTTQCLDIDECNDRNLERMHTCHPSASCVNTEGGYECVCPAGHDHDCKLSCWFEGREVENGETVAPAGSPCRRCTCKDGVITCREPICDCSIPSSQRDTCCRQCDPKFSCKHQELHHLVFRSGERWIYQCQTCECLNGEIDCWQMECPPVTCSNPVTEDGDCCPRCEDDPCARDSSINETSLMSNGHPRPCSYAGILHDSGSSWQDPHDKCTTCECKVPYCVELVSNSACCVHRTGSYAVATITAALAIWATSEGGSGRQAILVALLCWAYRNLRDLRTRMVLHRKQQYQRSATRCRQAEVAQLPERRSPTAAQRKPRTLLILQLDPRAMEKPSASGSASSLHTVSGSGSPPRRRCRQALLRSIVASGLLLLGLLALSTLAVILVASMVVMVLLVMAVMMLVIKVSLSMLAVPKAVNLARLVKLTRYVVASRRHWCVAAAEVAVAVAIWSVTAVLQAAFQSQRSPPCRKRIRYSHMSANRSSRGSHGRRDSRGSSGSSSSSGSFLEVSASRVAPPEPYYPETRS